MKLNKRIRTVLYEDQRFSAAELELLHTPAFQRLYDVHQLGLTDRIFLDASHSRLHHVVGVVEQATNLMASLERNLGSKPDVRLDYTGGPHNPAPSSGAFALLVKRRIPAARLMALLHDLTHAPYGHTLEDEIRLVEEKHDEPKRQADAFYRATIQYIGWLWRNSLPIEDSNTQPVPSDYRPLADHLNEYLDWTDLVDPKTDDEFMDFVASIATRLIQTADMRRSRQPFLRLGTADLSRFLKDLSFSMRALLFLEAAHKDEIKLRHIPDAKYSFDRLFDLIFQKLGVTRTSEEEFSRHRDAFMLDVIGNTICADLLDYAKRDAVNAGLKLDYDANRIIENFTLISHIQPNAKVVDGDTEDVLHPFEQHSVRTAISLFGHKLRTDVPGELLNLLQVRYYVYERMLYHPTKCIAGAMLGAAVQLVGWKSLPAHFQFTGDAVFLHDAREAAKIMDSLLGTCPDQLSPYTLESCEQLKRRLAAAPATSATRAAIKLLEDRVVRVGDLKKKLAEIQHLKASRNICQVIQTALNNDLCANEAAFDLSLKSRIIEQLPPASPEFKNKAEVLLASLVPNVAAIRMEISAGLRLFSRLISRKFYKAVFRLLPNVRVLEAKGIDANVIAKKFQNSTTRYIAEREIERRASLPIGSIVIHCPSADGPRKIANILITPGIDLQANGHAEAVPLYDVGKLHDPIFIEHQKAIRALQDMYGSMWRLVVSVEPPKTAKWESIAREAGSVIYELLTRGDDAGGPAQNDKYMTMEIEASLRADKINSSAWIQMPDGSGTEMPVAKLQFLEEVSGVLESLDEFKDLFKTSDGGSFESTLLRTALARFKVLVEEGKATARVSRTCTSAQAEAAPSRTETPVPTPVAPKPESGSPPVEDDLNRALEVELDAVLRMYERYVAEDEWERVQNFRSSFLERANSRLGDRHAIISKLQRLRSSISLKPGERVERNYGQADPVIESLERLLS